MVVAAIVFAGMVNIVMMSSSLPQPEVSDHRDLELGSGGSVTGGTYAGAGGTPDKRDPERMAVWGKRIQKRPLRATVL